MEIGLYVRRKLRIFKSCAGSKKAVFSSNFTFMSCFKLLLLSFLLLGSCKRKTPDTGIPVADSMARTIDNLGIDTTISIAANFPDSVRNVLFHANRDLYFSILAGYQEKGNTAVFSFENFVNFVSKMKYDIHCCGDVLQRGFDPDSGKTDPILIARRESDNKIERIEYRRIKKSNQFIISSQLLFSGKNYILKWQVFAPDNKTSYEVHKLIDSYDEMHYHTDYDVIKL